MNRFGTLIAALGQEIGIDLSADPGSPVEIRVDDFPVTLTSYDDQGAFDMVFSSVLGIVKPENELGIYRIMLDGNVFWTATADATLGVNADTREAVLCFRTSMTDLDGRRLAEMLDTFLFVARNWANFLEAVSAAAPDDVIDHEQLFIRI